MGLAEWAITPAHRSWEKWSSSSVGSSPGEIKRCFRNRLSFLLCSHLPFPLLHRRLSAHRRSTPKLRSLRAFPRVAYHVRPCIFDQLGFRLFKGRNITRAEQRGTNLSPADLSPFMEAVRRNDLPRELFFIGSKQCEIPIPFPPPFN